jgi:hypothetical protein
VHICLNTLLEIKYPDRIPVDRRTQIIDSEMEQFAARLHAQPRRRAEAAEELYQAVLNGGLAHATGRTLHVDEARIIQEADLAVCQNLFGRYVSDELVRRGLDATYAAGNILQFLAVTAYLTLDYKPKDTSPRTQKVAEFLNTKRALYRLDITRETVGNALTEFSVQMSQLDQGR